MLLALAPIIVGFVLAVLATILLAVEVTIRLVGNAGKLGVLAFRR